MAIIKRIGTATAIAVLCLAFVAPAGAASDITVGDFVQKLASVKGVASTDARVANDSLRGLGIRLPGDLEFSSRLTEGHVAIISRAAGLNVLTSNPLNDFTSQQTDAFLINFKDEFGSDGNSLRSDTNPGGGSGPGTGNGGPAFDPFTKGKPGKGKGMGVFTPTDPE
jgi:hypothetical protein